MIYSHHNARGATVHDVMARSQLHAVMSVDTESGVVECTRVPPRVDHRGEVETFPIRFSSIYPIYAGNPTPILFHCYGRLVPNKASA